MDDNKNRFDILEEIDNAHQTYKNSRAEEKERWENRKEIHEQKLQDIQEDYSENLEKFSNLEEIEDLIHLKDQIKSLNEKKNQLMDEVEEIFFLGLNSFVDGRRVTGGKQLTIKDNGVHRYGYKNNTEMSLQQVMDRSAPLHAAMKKTDHYEEFQEMWQVLEKMDIGRGSSISSHVELNPPVQFLDYKRSYVQYTVSRPARVDIVESKVFEDGKYSRAEDVFKIDRENLTKVSQRNPEPLNLKAVLRFHDKIKEVMESTLKKGKETLQENRELKRELSEPAQTYIMAHQL